MNNNASPIGLGPLNVSADPVWPAPLPPYGKIDYPPLGGIWFAPSDKSFGNGDFGIFPNVVGSVNTGPSIVCGGNTRPVINFGIYGTIGAAEVVSVYDTAGVMLFAVTGTGITKVNKMARVGSGPVGTTYAALGTGRAIAIAAGGTDSAFQAQVTAGTGATGGNSFHIAFATPFLTKPIIVAGPEGAGDFSIFNSGTVNNVDVNGFDWYMTNVPQAGGPQFINFIVIG
jgi:hypothetical protein